MEMTDFANFISDYWYKCLVIMPPPFLILKDGLVVCGLFSNCHSHSCRKVENAGCDMMKHPLLYHKISLRGRILTEVP